MRILYLNAFLTRYDFWTGERGRQLVDALREGGAEVVTYPEPCGPTNTDKSTSTVRSKPFKSLAKRWLPDPLLWFVIDCYLFIQGIKRMTSWGIAIWRRKDRLQPDIILSRTFEYDLTPWLVSRILNRPLVLEIHSPFYIERQFRGRGKSRVFRYFERLLWRSADRLWVHTNELRRIIVENGIESGRVHVIPFGVRDHKGGSEASSEPQSSEDINVVFVGSFYQWHGIAVLLEAFHIAQSKVKLLRLCVIGDGVTRRANEQLARTLGIDSFVEFPGWLPHEQVASRLHRADIGVAPYTKVEPFYMEPVKVLDYMTAGLAIIGSAQGQICDLLQDGRSGLLVPPDDVDALANALVRLGEDSALREQLGRRAKADAPTWERTAASVTAVCYDVLNTDNKPTHAVAAGG